MKKSPSETLTVDSDDADRRLDNFLLSRLKGLPRPLIYRMIRGGEVRVNKGRARPSRRLVAGDQVRIPPLQRTPERGAPVPDRTNVEWIEERVGAPAFRARGRGSWFASRRRFFATNSLLNTSERVSAPGL